MRSLSFVSALDLRRAYRVGQEAVERLDAGERDFLASISRSSTSSNQVEFTSVTFAEMEDYCRVLPGRWISHGNFDVTDEYIEYVEQLIGDEPVDIPGLSGKLAFACPRKPNVEKKLKPWSAEWICEGNLVSDSQIPAQSGIYEKEFKI